MMVIEFLEAEVTASVFRVSFPSEGGKCDECTYQVGKVAFHQNVVGS